MDGPKQELTISKAEAASRHVDEAIKALERGDFDIAITLAGAAEGMFDRPGMHLWNYTHARAVECAEQLFDDDDERRTDPEKQRRALSDVLNGTRTWLKHHGGGDRRTIDRDEAVGMIMRAMSKLENWTSRMSDFADGLRRDYGASP
jgi:hypothetical protein